MKLNYMRNLLFAFLVAVLLLAVIPYFIFMSSADKPEPTPTQPAAFDAAVMCQVYISERLKAPKTAEFALIDEDATIKSGGSYLVHSYVDAENSFGAKVRIRYQCNIEYLDGSWRLISLNVDE